MQIDSHAHGISQSLRCLLYDCFSRQQSLFLLGNGAIIKQQEHKKATLYFLSQDFSHIAKIVHISGYLTLDCIKYSYSKDLCMVIYPQDKYICLQTIDNHTKQEKISKLYSQLKVGQYFLAFSSIFRMKYYDLLIGYTSLRQFYLITIKNGKELQIFKLRKKQKFFNLISWLILEIVNQYKDCFIHVYKVDESENFILMLCIRDNNATLFLLQLFPESQNTTIKQVAVCELLQKIIPASSKLSQALVVTKDSLVKNLQCILSYQLKDGFYLFLSMTVNFKKTNIFDVSVILEGVPAPTTLAFFHVHFIYYTFDNNSQLFKCYKRRGISSHDRKNQEFKEFQMFLTFKEKPFFMNLQDQLFIATVSEVHQIQAQPSLSSQQSDLSQLQQHLAQFKNQINLTYKRQIHKLCKKNPIPIEQITYLLTQKYHKIIQWIKNEFSQSYHEEQSYLILTLEIISTLSAKYLLSIIPLQDILQRLRMKSAQIELKDLYAIISGNEIAPIINLINILAEYFPIIVHQILNKIQSEKAILDTCFQAIKTVYSQAYEKMFQSKSVICSSDFMEEDLIRTMVGLDLGNTVIYENLIIENPILFKDSILQYKTLCLFIEYYFQIDFKEQEVKSLVDFIHASRRQHFRRFIGQLLVRFRKEFKKGKPLIKKIGLLISGFLQYPLQITSQMKKIYPGLLFFYYLRIGQKKQGVQFIKNLLQDPTEEHSHLINLTIMKAQGSQLFQGSIICETNQSKQNKIVQSNKQFEQILRIGCEQDSSSQNYEHSNKKIKLQ